MAETSAVAFGRYLRTLRERRGLSLDQVQSLSRAFAEPVLKGNLSRCENGRQRLAYSKMIALCRIYEIPDEVLSERAELDLELDRIGSPDTDGLSFEELTKRGKEAVIHGLVWEGLAFFRDAIPLSGRAPALPKFRNVMEQSLCAIMNHALVAARLGKDRFALHELEHIRTVNGLGTTASLALLQLLSQRYRVLGQFAEATSLADSAIDAALRLDSPKLIAQSFANKGFLCYRQGQPTAAIELYKKAFPLFRTAGLVNESTRMLMNLAQVYFDIGRLRAAKRALFSAERLAVKHDLRRARALLRVLLGELCARDGDYDKAIAFWREAIDMSRRLHDQVTRFKAEFQLYKYARAQGDAVLATSLERLLRRRASRIPRSVDELLEFRSLSATSQHHASGFPARNEPDPPATTH